MNLKNLLAIVVVGLLTASPARAVKLEIAIESLAASDSVATSPYLVAAHDGTFDLFDFGDPASAGIEDVAELGNGTQLATELTTAVPTAVVDTVFANNGGFNGAIFSPGSSGSIILEVDPLVHRYLSFGAMVVPSNDAFFGNEMPTEIELFDAAGNFVATNFTLTGDDIWDAGTEVNQLAGSAYVVGQTATDGTAEGGNVSDLSLNAIFDPFLGAQTPPGATFNSIPSGSSPIASFSFNVVPEPSSVGLVALGLIAAGGLRRWRRRA